MGFVTQVYPPRRWLETNESEEEHAELRAILQACAEEFWRNTEEFWCNTEGGDDEN